MDNKENANFQNIVTSQRGIMEIKRENFHINIRKLKTETQFQKRRQKCIETFTLKLQFQCQNQQEKEFNDIIQHMKYLGQEESELTYEDLQKYMYYIWNKIDSREHSVEFLLDLLELGAQLMKLNNEVEALFFDDDHFHELVNTVFLYCYGKNQLKCHNENVTIYAAKFIKRFLIQVNDYDSDDIADRAIECTYYLLQNYSNIKFVKKGLFFIFLLLKSNNSQIAENFNQLFNYQRDGVSLPTLLCQYLDQRYPVALREDCFDTICQSFIICSEETIKQFVEMKFGCQQISFIKLITEECLQLQENETARLLTLLKIILIVLIHYEDHIIFVRISIKSLNKKEIKEELKSQVEFINRLQKGMFNQNNQVALRAHEICSYLEIE